MQGADVLVPLVSRPAGDRPAKVPHPSCKDDAEQAADGCWTLHTPPLRYDVASLQHWLDLNA